MRYSSRWPSRAPDLPPRDTPSTRDPRRRNCMDAQTTRGDCRSLESGTVCRWGLCCPGLWWGCRCHSVIAARGEGGRAGNAADPSEGLVAILVVDRPPALCLLGFKCSDIVGVGESHPPLARGRRGRTPGEGARWRAAALAHNGQAGAWRLGAVHLNAAEAGLHRHPATGSRGEGEERQYRREQAPGRHVARGTTAPYGPGGRSHSEPKQLQAHAWENLRSSAAKCMPSNHSQHALRTKYHETSMLPRAARNASSFSLPPPQVPKTPAHPPAEGSIDTASRT